MPAGHFIFQADIPAGLDNKLCAKLHERLVDEAAWIWIVKDLNPRALGANVKGMVPAQSWYLDLTGVHKK